MIGDLAPSMTRERFDDLLPTHRIIPVTRVLFADSDTPATVYRRVAQSRNGTFLLESAEQGGVWTRFSFVGCSTFGVLTERNGKAHWQAHSLEEQRLLAGGVSHLAPLEAVNAVYQEWSTDALPGLPPLTGGLVGYIGWETVRQLERLPTSHPDDIGVPDQALSFVSELIAIDHKAGLVVLIANALNDGYLSSDELWAEAQSRLNDLAETLASPLSHPPAEFREVKTDGVRPQSTRESFLESVERAKAHITAGDVFQVVLSQRFDLDCEASPLDVYRMLRHLNPSPYLYLLSVEDTNGEPFAIVGSSPEALVTVQNRRVMTHPIAGSRPRGDTVDADLGLEQDLLSDKKERAEHLMLVDLARNDLSKVCEPTTIDVSEFMRIERYSHIMHIVSTVEGDLRAGATPIDVFAAAFPAGTLSGAPKPRALEIIDELEQRQRGVYGGVVGYFGFAGDADLAIAIRTATIKNGVAHVQAGAGIVADSDPVSEFEECRSKAAAPLRAVALANALKPASGSQ